MSDTTDNHEKEIEIASTKYDYETNKDDNYFGFRHGMEEFRDTIHKRVVEEKDGRIEYWKGLKEMQHEHDTRTIEQDRKTIAQQSAEIKRLRKLLVVANGCLKEVGEYPITVAKITEALKPKE